MKSLSLVALIAFGLLGSLVVGLQTIEVSQANWIPISPTVPPPLPPVISVSSPNALVYADAEVELNLSVEISLRDDVSFRIWNETLQAESFSTLHEPFDSAGVTFVSYILDGAETILFNMPSKSVGVSFWNHSVYLSGLSEGPHTLVVNASGRQCGSDLITMAYSPDKDPIFYGRGTVYSADVWNSAKVIFTVNASIPKITIYSPQNKTYNSNIIQLNFVVDEPLAWAGYSLDEGSIVGVSENNTLPELNSGQHILSVYANDAAMTPAASETIYFSIEKPTPTTSTLPSSTSTLSPTNSSTQTPTLEHSPTPNNTQENLALTIIVIGLAVIAVVVGLLIYFKKRKG